MDLAALFNGTYEDALALVEKRAEDVRAGLVKTAAGLNDWVNQQVGSFARSGAADRIGNWWRDASADPAKLGLMGAGAGLGLGAAGSMLGPKGRRRPLQGALLGGLMGGAALGGYGLLRQVAANKAKPFNDLNVARANTAAAEEAKTTAELARNPMSTPKAVGRDATDAAKRLAAGDIPGAIDSSGKALSNADVVGVQELFDASGKNDRLAPSTFINKGTDKAMNIAERNGLLNPGEGGRVAEYLKLPTVNPAVEGVGTLALADATMAARANSLYNPKFLQTGLTDPSGNGVRILSSALGSEAAGRDAATQLGAMRAHRGVGGNLIPGNNSPDLKTALGGRLPARTLGIGGGFDYTPSPLPPGATGAAPVPGHVSDKALRQVAAVGRAGEVAAAGDAKGFLRSGFGTAQGGRLGPGLTLPRGIVYPAVPGAIHWSQTRVQNHNAAVNNLSQAQQAQAGAQAKVDALKKPPVPAVKPPGA